MPVALGANRNFRGKCLPVIIQTGGIITGVGRRSGLPASAAMHSKKPCVQRSGCPEARDHRGFLTRSWFKGNYRKIVPVQQHEKRQRASTRLSSRDNFPVRPKYFARLKGKSLAEMIAFSQVRSFVGLCEDPTIWRHRLRHVQPPSSQNTRSAFDALSIGLDRVQRSARPIPPAAASPCKSLLAK
jgi:hypothetical protein